MQDWKRELKRISKSLEKPRPKAPNPRVRVFWAAVREYALLHYAHNPVAKPIRY